MTTEIAILNKSAVALAADSAVTISSGHNNESKIYNSVNKLFALSKHHPVGIMIYDSAQVMGIPWETIIKSYRKKLSVNVKDTVEEYVNDFLSYLKENFLEEEIETQYIYNIVRSQLENFRTLIMKKVESEILKNGNISETQTKNIISITIEPLYKFLQEQETIEDINEEEYIRSFSKKHKDFLTKIIGEVLEKIPIKRTDIEKLLEIPALYFCKNFFLYKTGIAISGFGESEIFPSLHEIYIECKINGKLKFKRVNKVSVKSVSSCIIPFAQDSTIRTFVDGIDPNLEVFRENHLKSIFEEYKQLIIKLIGNKNDEHNNKLAEIIDSVNKRLIDDHNYEMIKFKRKEHIDPILSAVQFLPKDELAAMAEALINITSLRKRISITPETVGGPVDVAVISKGDGFIWVKRKHYFDPNLNHQFFDNYYD